VCCTLVRCEVVGFKVTGIKFMTVFITRKDAACFLATFTKILPLYLPKKGRFTALSQLLCLMTVFGREASTGCVW